MSLVECVPNFSEGQRAEVVQALCGSIESVSGVQLLDSQSDAVHNRSVLTMVGSQEAVEEAAFKAVETASRIIDLTAHRGAHPRFGATDVVPFVPLRTADMPLCVEMAHRLGRRVATELGIPVYFYEEAARSAERRDLAAVRAGEFEGLRETIETDPRRKPDEGPARIHPTAGAVAVGARPPLIAYNVNLATSDLGLAKSIARDIRERDGGLPRVKAIGLAVDDGVQVSMNLTDYHVTGILRAFGEVRDRASAAGVAVARSEIVGLVPLDALVGLAVEAVAARGFSEQQVLEGRLLESFLRPETGSR